MDFSTEFVALRDRLAAGQDKLFTSRQNVEIAGRMAALMSTFEARSTRKILGLMPTGGSGHAHEYRLLFAVPTLDEAALEDWWQYALQTADELVKPDKNHDFSLISLMLAAGDIDKAALKKLKKLADERRFEGGKHGWSSVRVAVIDLGAHKVHTNRMGDSLKNIIQPLL